MNACSRDINSVADGVIVAGMRNLEVFFLFSDIIKTISVCKFQHKIHYFFVCLYISGFLDRLSEV